MLFAGVIARPACPIRRLVIAVFGVFHIMSFSAAPGTISPAAGAQFFKLDKV